jgi:hypothetical protein
MQVKSYQNKKTISPALRDTIWIFACSRLLLLVVGSFAVNFLSPAAVAHIRGAPEVLAHASHNDLMAYLLAWWRWDANFYIRIAAHGYWAGVTVFFPLWPILIRLLGEPLQTLIKGNTAYYITGVITSNLLFFAAILMLYTITNDLFSAKTARSTLIFLSFSPYSLFFFAGYTESLFLFLCLAVFFFLQKRGELNWFFAILSASLASITREAGVLLLIPLIIVLVRRFTSKQTSLKTIVKRTISLILIPLTVLGYMFYLDHHYGNPLLFLTAAINWNRHPVIPGIGIYTTTISLITGAIPYIGNNLPDLLFSLLSLILIAISLRKLPLELSLFSLASWLFFASTLTYGSGPLMSYPRYATVIFPIFMLGASWLEKRPILKYLCLTISILLLCLNTFLFITNQWVA